jgi:hypothetical protein
VRCGDAVNAEGRVWASARACLLSWECVCSGRSGAQEEEPALYERGVGRRPRFATTDRPRDTAATRQLRKPEQRPHTNTNSLLSLPSASLHGTCTPAERARGPAARTGIPSGIVACPPVYLHAAHVTLPANRPGLPHKARQGPVTAHQGLDPRGIRPRTCPLRGRTEVTLYEPPPARSSFELHAALFPPHTCQAVR